MPSQTQNNREQILRLAHSMTSPRTNGSSSQSANGHPEASSQNATTNGNQNARRTNTLTLPYTNGIPETSQPILSVVEEIEQEMMTEVNEYKSWSNPAGHHTHFAQVQTHTQKINGLLRQLRELADKNPEFHERFMNTAREVTRYVDKAWEEVMETPDTP